MKTKILKQIWEKKFSEQKFRSKRFGKQKLGDKDFKITFGEQKMRSKNFGSKLNTWFGRQISGTNLIITGIRQGRKNKIGKGKRNLR